MTAPAGPESVTLDDLQPQAPIPPDLTTIKVDGDDVPAEFKGKSVAELMQQATAYAEALKTSERARTTADQMAALAARTAPPVPEPPKEEPPLTDEQLAELHTTDPIKAIKYMQSLAINAAARNYDARLTSLAQSTTAGAEAQARTKYAAEFEALGPEISAMVQQIPNAAQVLTSSEAWERLISLVRGTPGNFEKIIQHRAGKTLEAARAGQVADAGISMTSAVRAPAPVGGGQLDATQKEIAGKLGLTEAEYLHWSKV